MHEPVTYRIDVRGQVEEREMNAGSPIQATVARAEPAATLFTIHMMSRA